MNLRRDCARIKTSFLLVFLLTVSGGLGRACPVPDLVIDDLFDFRPGGKLRRIRELKDAKEALRAGDASKCREFIAAYCKSDSDTPHPTVMLVGLFLEEKQDRAALDALAELSLDPKATFESHFAFARLAGKQRRWQDAWAHLRLAEMTEKPERWSAEYKNSVQQTLVEIKAVVAMGRRDWKVARPILADIAKARPDDADALRRLATCSFHLQDLPLAERLFQRAARADKGDDLPFQVRLAGLYLQKESTENQVQAESYYKLACAVPGKPGQLARIQYSAWLQGKNRPKDVLALLLEAGFDASLSREQEYLLGLAHRMLGEHQVASQHFTKLHRGEPRNIRVSNQLALVLVESTKKESRDRALRIAQENVDRVRTEATIGTLAWIKFCLGDVQEAQQLLTSLATSSVSRNVAFYHSQILQAKGRLADADKMLEIVKQSPGPFYYQHRLPDTSATR